MVSIGGAPAYYALQVGVECVSFALRRAAPRLRFHVPCVCACACVCVCVCVCVLYWLVLSCHVVAVGALVCRMAWPIVPHCVPVSMVTLCGVELSSAKHFLGTEYRRKILGGVRCAAFTLFDVLCASSRGTWL